MTRNSIDSLDPLALAIAPPKDETPEQRAAREREEAEARRVSDAIDEQLKAERNALKRKKTPIKVLLLGQSESGKSTTVKNFQIAYANNAWQEERAAWRAVIHLNLVRSVNVILDALSREMKTSMSPGQVYRRLSPPSSDTDDEDAPAPVRPPTAGGPAPAFSEQHALLQLRLAPLQHVQRDLEDRLGAGSRADELRGPAAAFADGEVRRRNPTRPREFVVRSREGWHGVLGARPSEDARGKRRRDERLEEAAEVLFGCSDDIRALWADPVVQAVLARRNMRMQDSPGFFLDDLDRIASRDYEPSDDDVVRARLRTMGVQQYTFVFEKGRELGREWIMYDVGGARSRRAAWYPYFMDVNAIIFLAPISVFDEQLEEDHRVNRLEDSYLLWRAVCASKLLAKVQLILFLNKCDLLQRKLKRGTEIRKYVPTYGERANDLPTAAKYFRTQFREISRKSSPEPRGFYSFLTSVVDTKSTAITLGTVREGIMRNQLQDAELI